MDGLTKKKRAALPPLDRERIVQEYLSGLKTGVMLAREYGLHRNSVSKIVGRYNKKNSSIFTETISKPIMPRKKAKLVDSTALQVENEQLKRQLQRAHLKIEGYQIMGDILEEEYGIDLLKKAGAGQCRVSKKDTQK